MPYEVKLEKFAGPLELLLDLIESEKLPITEVSLAEVTEAYLRFLNANTVPPEELADFLVVATKLLLIKSRAILPLLPNEVEEDAGKLALQLRMYREFVEASRGIEALWLSSNRMFARERALVIKPVGFAPPPGVTATIMRESFAGLLKRLEPFFALERAALERVVSVQERIGQIREAILERSRMTFRDVVRGAKSKVDVVVSFLALLELVKQRLVSVVQGDSFSDIEIQHVE